MRTSVARTATRTSYRSVRRRLGGSAVQGLTLLELLVVVVLASFLGTLVIQGIGFFLGQYRTVIRIGRIAALTHRQEQWFVSTVRGLVPSVNENRRFKGEGKAFEGVTLSPLAARPGRPVKVRWSIDTQDGEDAVLTYEEAGEVEWTLSTLPHPDLSFQYADVSGRWRERWPFDVRSRQGIPSMVRVVADADRTVWMARPDLFPYPVVNFRDSS